MTALNRLAPRYLSTGADFPVGVRIGFPMIPGNPIYQSNSVLHVVGSFLTLTPIDSGHLFRSKAATLCSRVREGTISRVPPNTPKNTVPGLSLES